MVKVERSSATDSVAKSPLFLNSSEDLLYNDQMEKMFLFSSYGKLFAIFSAHLHGRSVDLRILFQRTVRSLSSKTATQSFLAGVFVYKVRENF